MINKFFAEDEIDEIWVTFPDPFLRKSKANRRLTSHYFLNMYKDLIKNGGAIHLKTDSEPLYLFSKESFDSCPFVRTTYDNNDIYSSELFIEELNFKTYYELKHLANGLTIRYLRGEFLS